MVIPMPTVRPETPNDADSITDVTHAAFANAPHRSGTEAAIVSALRASGELTVSLVADIDERIVGHVAVSPVRISDRRGAWYGLGPVSVLPSFQGKGIGAALIRQALTTLQTQGADGCVVLGDPAYYTRFGFAVVDGLVLPGVPASYFQALRFTDTFPQGDVTYSPAFDVTD